MLTFIGDYTCKLDVKGRTTLPSPFIRQMAGAVPERFVVKKDVFEECLILYPIEEWQRQTRIIRSKLNQYNRQHQLFMRRFFKGVAEVVPDANNRLLIPKRLLDEVGASKEIVLAGQPGKIELWDKSKYDGIELSNADFADMAENLMDGIVDDLE